MTQGFNRQRMKKLGAHVTIRPIRAYPELLVRSLVATGTEEVLENLFIHEGDHMIRLDFPFEEKIGLTLFAGLSLQASAYRWSILTTVVSM